MRTKLFTLAAAAALTAPLLATAATSSFYTVDQSGVANTSFSSPNFFVGGAPFPSSASGPLVLDGVPYLLPSSGNHMWHSAATYGDADGTVVIPVGVFGVDVVYTLMGTFWGERSVDTFASITFTGSAGDSFTLKLDGNAEIRDYNFNPTYTTTLNPAVSKEVWSNGTGPNTQHIDRQRFDLPTAFLSQTLTSITLRDTGAESFQRVFIAATTVEASPVPEPTTLALVLAGLGVVQLTRSRRAQG